MKPFLSPTRFEIKISQFRRTFEGSESVTSIKNNSCWPTGVLFYYLKLFEIIFLMEMPLGKTIMVFTLMKISDWPFESLHCNSQTEGNSVGLCQSVLQSDARRPVLLSHRAIGYELQHFHRIFTLTVLTRTVWIQDGCMKADRTCQILMFRWPCILV
jgi:hypothetical protein